MIKKWRRWAHFLKKRIGKRSVVIQDFFFWPIRNFCLAFYRIPMECFDKACSGGSKQHRSWLARIWRGFDSKFMKPLLTASRPSLMETMPPFCGPLTAILTTAEQRGVAVPLTDDDGCAALEQGAYQMSGVSVAASSRSDIGDMENLSSGD